MFQAFHNCKYDQSTLSFSIAQLWPLVSISKEERSKLISMLSASIRQIIAEDKSEWEIKGGNVKTFDFKC